MRDIRDLLAYVMPHAPMCAEPIAIQHLRKAATKFCERTRSWRVIQTLNIDEDNEAILVCRDGTLFEIEYVRFREEPTHDWRKKLDPIAFNDVVDEYGNGIPKWYYQKQRGTLSIFPFLAGEIEVSAFAKPDNRATTLPDFILEEFYEVIANGALASILKISGQEYTNPQLALYFENEFNMQLDRLFDQNVRGQTRAPRRTKPRFF